MAALDEMKVKISADLSGLVRDVTEASKVVSAGATDIISSFKGSAAAADALETSLSSLAAKGNANIKAIADRALGISPIMSNLSKNVAAFGGGVISNKVPEYFKKLGEEAISTGGKLETVSKGVARSTTNYTGLSRILQDLPFGFVAISNNLTEILPAASAAGLAISAIVSAVTFASVGFGAWTRGMGQSKEALEAQKKAIEKAKEETLAFKDALKSAEAGALSTGIKLQQFVDIARDGEKPLDQRNNAIKEANKLLGEHGEKLTLVNINTKAVTDEINKFTNALVTQALAAKYADRIADLMVNQKEATKAYNKELASLNAGYALNQKLVKEAGGFANVDIFKLSDTQAQLKKVRSALDAYNLVTGDITEVQKDFNDTSAQSVKLFGEIGYESKKAQPHIKDVNDVLKELNKELALNQQLAGIGFISSAEEDTNKINKVKAAIEELLKLPKGRALNPDDSIISNLIGSIQPEEVRAQLTERMKVLSKELSTVSQTDLFKASDGKPITIPADVHITTNIKAALANLNKEFTDEFNKSAKEIQKSIINSGFSNLGDTIGAALGGGNVAGAFEGLLQTVINGMKQLGEAMIGLGTAKIALEKFNLAPGIGTVLAGVGIIALSSAIQAALPKFAGGVTGFGGGLALVGERGPEMVRLPQGSDVIPNHRLNGIAGGGPQVIIPDVVLRGDHLLLLFNRATQQQNRRG